MAEIAARNSASTRQGLATKAATVPEESSNANAVGREGRKGGTGAEERKKRNVQHFQKNDMSTQDLSSLEILQMILGDFDTESNTETALDVYLFAKKIANAAAVAMKLTSEFAVQKLIEQGGKGVNSFASYSIIKSYSTTFEADENRDAALAEIEAQAALAKAISERLAKIEKEMEKAGRVQKRETGQSIRVSFLEKI